MIDNLNIRSRRSAKQRVEKVPMRNPVADHTLDTDMDDIRKYAELYKRVDPESRRFLDMYVFEGKTLDYYHGCYVTAYQMFAMAFAADNDMAPTLATLVHAISSRIVSVYANVSVNVSTNVSVNVSVPEDELTKNAQKN